MDRLDDVLARALEALRPPPVEPFSAWIEREVRLPEGLSAEPGKVTLWPPQVEIANSIGDPEGRGAMDLEAARLPQPHPRHPEPGVNLAQELRAALTELADEGAT